MAEECCKCVHRILGRSEKGEPIAYCRNKKLKKSATLMYFCENFIFKNKNVAVFL
jgi:hypothetical protein